MYFPASYFPSLFSRIKRAFQFTGGSADDWCGCISQTPGLFRRQNAWNYPSHFTLKSSWCPVQTSNPAFISSSWKLVRGSRRNSCTGRSSFLQRGAEGAVARCLPFSAHPGSSSLPLVDRERHLPQLPHWARCFGHRQELPVVFSFNLTSSYFSAAQFEARAQIMPP